MLQMTVEKLSPSIARLKASTVHLLFLVVLPVVIREYWHYPRFIHIPDSYIYSELVEGRSPWNTFSELEQFKIHT